MRIIAGREQHEGVFKPGHNVKESFYAQHQLEALNIELEILDEMMRAGTGKTELELRQLKQAVIQASKQKPFLGICIGLQLLFEHSQEGDAQGLAILPGQVKKFPAARMHDAAGNKLKVPHMGWNQVYQTRQHPMWQDIEDGERFYYVHSYYVDPQQTSIIAGVSEYPDKFTSVIACENIFAVQFHPEKSQHAGLQLLKNFVAWDGTI